MLKVANFTHKLEQKLEIRKKLSKFFSVVEVKRLIGKAMIVAMLWQAIAQPALALGNLGENEDRKTEKDANATSPAVQNPGDLAIVRHSPSVNGSRIEGTVRVLLPESVNINSNAVVTGDLLIPGSPRINLNGNVTYNGTVIGAGNPAPNNHTVSLNSNVSLRHVVTRTDAITISPVTNPPQPTGTRDIDLKKGDSPGDFSTVRNITINSNYGTLTLPPGTYGNLTANSNSAFVLGVTGQTTTYNVQAITLNSNSDLQILGAVIINVLGNVSLNSQTNMGQAASPISLSLNISQGGLSLNSNSNFYGVVKAANGQVSLNSNSLLKGLVTSDRLIANSNSKIQPLVADVNRPVVTIEQPINGAVFSQAQVTVSGTVEDESVVTVKVNNVNATFNGGMYSATVPLNIGSNTITVVATDAFNNVGQAQVMVSRGDGSNLPPVVNAGADHSVNLPAQATLAGVVTDDGKPNPPGTVTITWSKISGPGTVTFSSPNTAITNAAFTLAGIYELELRASDSQLVTTDRVIITVTNTQTNQAPVVNAGQDQTITLPSIVNLTGIVTDDGLPSNQLVINWSKASGSGTVTFTNPTAASTTASFSAAGVYVLRLTAGDGQLSSSDDVQITVNAPAARFALLATPVSVTTVQNSNATYMINVTSNDPNFRQLVALSISTLPGTARATFNPQQVVAGSASTLAIDLSNSGVAPGTYNFVVTGSASIGSLPETQTANISLVVQAAGTTTLSGRVLSTEDEPLSGIAVSIDGISTVTDAAGSFLLNNVTAGNNRAILVDGRTTSTPGRTYPVIAEPVDVIAGQPNQVPYLFYLPRIDTQYEVTVVPNQNTTVTTPRVNGLSTLIPANSNLRNRDGSAVTRVSMTPVQIDRTPAPLPSNLATTLVYTNQPGGAIADVAMPVTYPNFAEASPGTLIPLYTFNHDTVTWVQYGVGKVSSDGRTIVPEIDPATNKPYGLRDFSWHFAAAGPQDCPDGSCANRNRTLKPVALTTGVKEEMMTDIAFGGARGGVSLGRIYTSDLAVVGISGHFGRGTRSNWEISVSGSLTVGGAARVTWPQEIGGRLFNYTRTEANGTLVFTTTSRTNLLGDELKKLTNGNIEYRSKNGDMMKFDPNGRLTSLVDRNSNTTTLTYSGNNLVQVTDPVGRSINMVYDGSGRIISATDPINRTWTYTYTGGTLATATDPLGHSMQYTYGIAARLETVRDKRGNLIKSIAYADNRVISQTFADGGVERYDYIFSGSLITAVRITDPENRVTFKRFNATGYVTLELDGLGQLSIITRDLNNNLETQVNGPCGCPEDIKTYDSKGNVLTMTDRLGQIMRYEYDPIFSFVTKITDKNGHITRFSYDSRGNRTSVINAKNEVTTFAYDQFGQQTSMTDALNHTWSKVYDAQGNVISKSDPLNNTSTMTYDGIGRRLFMSDPLGRTSSMVYDAMSRVISATDPANAITTYTYDENGNQISMTNALSNTWTIQFDAKNRKISQKFPLTPSDSGIQREMRMEYNKNNEITASISPSGRIWRYTYDSRGQRKTIMDPLNGTVSYTYDINQQLTSLSDQRNYAIYAKYDELYRPIKVTDPLGNFSLYNYDVEGNLVSSIDHLGRTTRIDYDELDRAITINYIDAIVTHLYDAAGRTTRIDDTQFGGSFISWNYDDANRLLSETTPQGMVSYTYNGNSERTSLLVLDSPPINYTYDFAGRLSTIKQSLENFTYSYDILSRRTSLQRPNGITTTYSYDEIGRLVNLKHQKNAGPIIEDLQYTFNADDEIAAIKSIYLPNLETSKTANSADSNNRISNFGGESYSFDSLGQTASKVNSSGTTLYNWDHRGRLVNVLLPNQQDINYKYDALGRRSLRVFNGTSTKFLYDQDDVVLDIENTNSKIHYIRGGVDEKLRQLVGEQSFYFLQNNINSTIALTDIEGNPVNRLIYDAFGKSSGTTITRYDYTGRERESLSGLLYYRYRWYDPQQGRFLTEDPIGFQYGSRNTQENNLYAYSINNPIQYTDPFGLSVQTVNCGAPDSRTVKRIERAVQQAGQAAVKCQICNEAAATLDKLDRLIIKCVPWFESPRTGESLCGYDSGSNFYDGTFPKENNPPDEIELTRDALSESAACGCLQATIFHETLHKLGYNHYPPKNVNAVEKNCFKCSNKNR